VKPLTTGAELRAEGRYSGVALAEDMGLSNGRRGGVKLLLSSRSRLLILTGANVAGAALTGVKPPALTGVKPEETGCGVDAGESNMGIFLILFSNSSFIEALRASEARTAGDSPRRLEGVCWCDFFRGEFAGDGVRGPPYSYSNC
jgi:hypothetical protein